MSISPDRFSLTPEQQQHLAAIAAETGLPPREIVDAALAALRSEKAFTGSEESFYDAAMRLGLIGCVPGGPSDLSSNPKYMEGFGRREP